MPDTDITFVLDRSGSMHTIRDQVARGVADFLADRRAEPGPFRVSLFRFNERCEAVYAGLPLADVPPLALEPFGNTALLDAIGEVIAATRLRLAATGDPARRVVIGIITDGQDNRSRRYTRAAISDLIEAQEAVEGWEFYYLGSNQDAVEVGTGLGVDAARSLTYAPENAAVATRALSQAIGRAGPARSAASGFTDAERTQSA